jgi:signal transduction histidine kinase
MLDEGLILLAVLFIAIAAGSYPVVRRLTRRLETLRKGVETFGGGALDFRVPVQGDDEVSAVAASFNRAAQRVEDLVRANRSLLANASHELRSPLARLKMAVSMLDTADPAQRERLRHEINVDIRELDVLVEEVLLASRLDAQQSGELRDLVEVGPLLIEEASRVQAGTEIPPEAVGLQVLGDERLLRRALRNLLENGRRYGGDELVAKLHQDGPLLRVQVCDRGPGVPESERERIFEPFFRLAGHSETAGGIGLGLSLVRQIAQRHGGTVACHPHEGGGSCFELALPLATLQA